MLNSGQKAWGRVTGSWTGTEAGGWGSDRKPMVKLQGQRAGKREGGDLARARWSCPAGAGCIYNWCEHWQ